MNSEIKMMNCCVCKDALSPTGGQYRCCCATDRQPPVLFEIHHLKKLKLIIFNTDYIIFNAKSHRDPGHLLHCLQNSSFLMHNSSFLNTQFLVFDTKFIS